MAETRARNDDDTAEQAAMAAAVAEARADPRTVPHAAVRDWLVRVAGGDAAAEPPAATP